MPRKMAIVAFNLAVQFLVTGRCVGSELRRTSFGAENLDSSRFVQLERLIDSDYFRQIRGVVVLKGGNILYENYFNGATRETLQDIRSAGKSLTSALMGIAFDKGFLADLERPLLSFFPEYDRRTSWDPRKDSITLSDALSMSTGLDISDGDYEEGSYGNVASYGVNWITDIWSKGMIFDPGSRFDYSSGAVSLLGPVIERSSGTAVPVFADSFLFKPLGITNYRWTEFPDGHVCTAGSFWMRAIDFAKFGQLYLQRGEWNGTQLISDEWIRISTQQRFLPAPSVAVGYGYYWWREEYQLDSRTIECFYAQGNGGNRVHVFPTENLVVAITSSAYAQPYMFDQIRVMINKCILPASILPVGSYASSASFENVPETGLSVTALILLSALASWPALALRRRRRGSVSSGATTEVCARWAKTVVWLGALIHLAFLSLIYIESSFELFLNTGYTYEITAFHLTINWLLLVSAVAAVQAAFLSVVFRWWRWWERGHVVLTALGCSYVLYLVFSWEALILYG